jgi:hypothetical protein
MKTKFKVVDYENYKILITNELLTEIAYQDWKKRIISAQNNSTYKITPTQKNNNIDCYQTAKPL